MKRTLKARDIERLENTSFASSLAGGPVDTYPDPEFTPICSIRCESFTCDCWPDMTIELLCTCACVSVVCCVTANCTELTQLAEAAEWKVIGR